MGGQQARVVPHQLLGGQPAHALDEAAFHLSDVDGRVDAATGVVQHVDGQYLGFTGQRVDGHFGAGRTVGKVVEGPAGQRGLVVVDLGCAVEAVAPQLDAVGIGGLHHVGENALALGRADHTAGKADGTGAAVVQPGHKGGQVVAHAACGVLGGAAVQVGAAAGGGGAGIGHLAGVAGRHLDLGQRHPQLVGHDLGDLGVQALSHFGATMVHLHRAVGVDMDQGAGLVEQRGGEADAELDRGDGNAALDHVIAGIPVRNRL